MTVVQDVKDRIDAVELIAETVKLRRSGSSYTGFCPFHDNKNTPSFVVWPDTGTWKCFGACNDGGDVFSFVMKNEGWDFGESLRHLARRAGLELQDASHEQQEKREEHERLYQLLTLAAMFYHDRLHNSSAGQPARDHLVQRGLALEVCDNFGLGYAPESWDASLTFFREKGYSEEQMVAAGLVVRKEQGGIYDRFRDRIMFPIRDQRGRTVGFGARVVDHDNLPKFMNSPQTDLFDKSALLYGVDLAHRAVRDNKTAVMVEGYTDVIAAHQAGFANVMSPMGTALTEKHLRLVKRFARRLVLALDPDVAGDRGTLRSLTVARETLDRESVPAFDPRGLVRNEGQLNMDIRVATLPPGIDPDELIARDPEAWRVLTSQAITIVDYAIEVFTRDRDLKDSKVKAEIIDDVMPIISDVSHPAERSDYHQKLARLLKVEERVLMGRGRWPNQQRRLKPPVSKGPSEHHSAKVAVVLREDELETYLLAAMVYRPDLLALADRSLRESGSSALSHKDFSQPGFQVVFKQLQSSLHQAELDPSDYLRDSLDPGLHDQLVELLSTAQDIDLQDERRLRDVVQAATRLRERNIGTWLTELRFLEQAAREQGDLQGASTYQDQTVTHTQSLKGIQRYLARQSRRERLADGLAN